MGNDVEGTLERAAMIPCRGNEGSGGRPMRPPSGRVRAPHPLPCKRASIMQLMAPAMDDFRQRWAALMARAHRPRTAARCSVPLAPACSSGRARPPPIWPRPAGRQDLTGARVCACASFFFLYRERALRHARVQPCPSPWPRFFLSLSVCRGKVERASNRARRPSRQLSSPSTYGLLSHHPP